MTPDAKVWDGSVLRNLRQAAEARGLTFFVNPSRDVIPDFLGDHQPDALARGPAGGLVIALKHRNGTAGNRQLSEIAQLTSAQPGWEFRAIYLNTAADQTPVIAKPTIAQLHAAVAGVQALSEAGYHAAALVAAWAILEALSRLATDEDTAEAPAVLSSLQVVQALAEGGYLESAVGDRLRGMAKLRDAVIHGDLSAHVPAKLVVNLLQDLRQVATSFDGCSQQP